MNIKAILSIFCLCGVMHATGQDILHRAYNRLKSIDFYSRIGVSKDDGFSPSKSDKAALAYGLALGGTFNLSKRLDLQVAVAWERGAVISEGDLGTIRTPTETLSILKRETSLHYTSFIAMPKYYMGRKGRFFVGLGGFASKPNRRLATDLTVSDGTMTRKITQTEITDQGWDFGVMFYGGVSFRCLRRPIEIAANLRQSFVETPSKVSGSFFILTSLNLTVSMPVYVFHQGSRKSRQSLK